MFESESFCYDNIHSDDMGVRVVNSNSGLFKENFLSNRVIIEKEVPGRNTPYFKGITRKPLSFPMTIFIEDWEKRDNLSMIARWFNQEEYKPLWFGNNPNKRVYALVEGSSDLLHNGCKDGYFTINIRCDSPFLHSRELSYKREIYGTAVDRINNAGDMTFKPFITIKKKGDGDVIIQTFMNQKQLCNMYIKDLLDGEIIEIDCAEESIRSNHQSSGRYLYDNHNDDWLEFGIGYPYDGESSTQVMFTGNFEIEMKYQYAYLIG